MATLKTNTLTGTSTAGSIAVTGEGNSTTTNLQQGLCKAWLNFNGSTTDAGTDLDGVRDSLNISSVVDQGTGITDENLTNNMGNTNYCGYMYANATASGTGRDNFNNNYTGGFGAFATDSFKTHSFADNSADGSLNFNGLFGDLA